MFVSTIVCDMVDHCCERMVNYRTKGEILDLSHSLKPISSRDAALRENTLSSCNLIALASLKFHKGSKNELDAIEVVSSIVGGLSRVNNYRSAYNRV